MRETQLLRLSNGQKMVSCNREPKVFLLIRKRRQKDTHVSIRQRREHAKAQHIFREAKVIRTRPMPKVLKAGEKDTHVARRRP